MYQCLIVITIIASVLQSSHASAVVLCTVRKTQLANHTPVIKVAVVGTDGRKTESEYASEQDVKLKNVQNRFAATGTLDCGSYRATAQLTGTANVITTVGHIFQEDPPCEKPYAEPECEFTVKIGKEIKTSKVKRLRDTGFKCPHPNPAQDWAVAELKDPIQGVEPYALPTGSDKIQIGDALTSVAAQSIDFVKKEGKRRGNPKSIEECTALSVSRNPDIVQSDCDGSKGASGGSILKRNGSTDVLVGVMARGAETPEQFEETLRTGKSESGEFREWEWYTHQVPLSGAFLNSLIQVVSEQ